MPRESQHRQLMEILRGMGSHSVSADEANLTRKLLESPTLEIAEKLDIQSPIPSQAFDALLIAKTAEATFKCAESLPSSEAHVVELKKLDATNFQEAIDNFQWPSENIKNLEFRKATAINFLGAVLEEAYKQTGGKLPDELRQDVSKGRAALEALSIHSFEDAAKMLYEVFPNGHRHGPSIQHIAPSTIGHLAVYNAHNTGNSIGVGVPETQNAIFDLRMALRDIGNHLTSTNKLTASKWPTDQIARNLSIVTNIVMHGKDPSSGVPKIG